MEAGDIDVVHAVTVRTFDDLDRRSGRPPSPGPSLAQSHVRFRRLLASDPGGAWVAERGGEIIGSALALVREGLWGLSLLVVRPDAQSDGIGRELLARAHAYGNGVRGRVVLASNDPRALRSYARLGLTLNPATSARGRPKPGPVPPEVRPGTPADLPLTAAVDRAVRGAAHGDDLPALLEAGHELLVLPERGYAVVRDGAVKLLAAYDESAAATLLRAALASAADGEATVEWITGAQAWAIGPCLDAGLELRIDMGAVFVAGDVGRFAPYLPNGAYI
jgi:GNAT superfamily N-acetyltransferase